MPQELAQAKIDEANFKKSLDYGIDKLGFGMFESTFSFCENLLNLLIGLSPLLWDTATYYATSYGLVNKDSSLVYTEIIQSAPFLGVVQIINEVSTSQCQHAWCFADEAIEAEQIEGFGTLSHIREIAAYQFMGPMPAEVERLKTLNSCLPGLKFP